jgi:hypothetical protein
VQRQCLPHGFPHFRTVNACCGAWRDEGVSGRLNAGMTRLARVKEGRAPEPAAAIAGTQPARTSGNVPVAGQGTGAGRRSPAGSGAS